MARSPQLVLIDPDPSSREEVRRMLALGGFAVLGTANYGTEALVLCQQVQPDVVVLALSAPLARGFQTVQAIMDSLPETAVVVYSSLTELKVLRRAMLLGVRDFIPRPFKEEALASAIRSVLEMEERRRARREGLPVSQVPFGSLITVFGTKGGVGKTTIATNLAVGLAQRHQASVALVDLDTRFGDVATLMDLQVDRSIVDLALHADDISPEQIKACMVRHWTGVEVLAAPQWKGDWATLLPDHVSHILSHLARSYDFVIVDTPGSFNDLIARSLEMSTLSVLVTTPDVSGLKDALVVLDMLRSWSYPQDKLLMVLNHTSPSQKVSDHDVRRALGMSPAWRIPFDKQVTQSVQAGKPLVASQPRAKATQVLLEMVAHLSGQEGLLPNGGDRPGEGLMGRVFRLKKENVKEESKV